MDDESSDILGQQTKPVLRRSKNADSPGTSLTVKLVFGCAILFGLYFVAMRIWFRVLLWKERSHKLAMRRRHGIPDNDHRPFNVAYAAVLRARQEKEAAQTPKVTQPVPTNDRRNAQAEQNVRQRFGFNGAAEVPRATSTYGARLPGGYIPDGTPATSQPESSAPPVLIGPGRYPSQSLGPRRYESGTPSYLTGYRRFSRRGIDLDEVNAGQKRGLAEDLWYEQQAAKRSARESGLIGDDGDGAVWQDQVLQRGAKRYLLDEDNEDDVVERQTRDKRARKASLEKGIQVEGENLDMDIDEEEDEVDDLPYIQRGKKRDRAEAGSTFGADDDDSGIEVDSPDSKAKRRTRKRRTFSKRKSEAGAAIRGQKRDRDSAEEETDPEAGDENSYVVRKKRGKKGVAQEDDLSENSTTRSLDSSSSRNRKIGEEWTSNGIRWKIGPNGQRLRQALVKKARQRFPMPQDSQHPDRELDFEVYVESWLSEEEYRDAKQRHVLAGQDTPKRSNDKLTLEVQTQVNGKNLLWSSTTTPVDSPISRSPISERALGANQRILKTSLSSSGSPRTNPFDQAMVQNMRRISSTSRTISVGHPGLADSTNSSPHTRYKTYSKLEKQELEAAALMKLRELKSKKEAETYNDQATKQKENIEGGKAMIPGFNIPTITVSTPSETAIAPAQPAQDNNSSETSKAPSFIPFPSSTDTTKIPDAPKPSPFPTNSTPTIPPVPAPAPKADAKPTHPTTAPPSLFFPLSTPSVSGPSTSTQTSHAQGPFAVTGTTNAPNQTTKPPMPSFPGTDTQSKATVIPGAPQSDAAKTLFTFGLNSQPGDQKAPATAPASQPAGGPLFSRLGPNPPAAPSTTVHANPPQTNSFFNLVKPANNITANTTNTTNNTPNPFSTNPSPATTQPTSSDNSTNPGSQIKFNFKLPSSTSASSITGSRETSSTDPNTAPVIASTTSTGHPFAGVAKGPDRPMVTFTSLVPDGGIKDFSKTTVNSTTTQADPGPSSFGPVAPTPGVNGDTSRPPASVFGGTSNPFGISAPSNPSNVFGPLTTTFGAKPGENKPTDSSSAQTTKPIFSFGMNSGQTLSNNTNPAQGSMNVFGQATTSAPKAGPPSSSLFGALGPQSTSTFGTTSTPGAFSPSAPVNVFESNNTGSSSMSAPTSVFGNTSAGASSGSTPTSIFGTQTSTSSSGNQASDVFGNTNTTSLFGPTSAKPTESPKSSFSATSTPPTNGPAVTPAAEQAQQTFKFQMPSLNTNNTNTNPPITSTSSSSSGPQFTFKFDPRPAGSVSPPAASSGKMTTFASRPTAFGINTAFGSTSGSSS